VAAADFLDERVLGADHLCAAELVEAARRPESGLQSAVVGFDPVGVLFGVVPGARSLGDDLDRGDFGGVQRPGEESGSPGTDVGLILR